MPRFDNPDALNAIDVSESHLGTQTDRAIMGLKASNIPASMFISGNSPVRILESDSIPKIESLDVDKMRFELDRRINWFRKSKTQSGDWEVSRTSPKVEIVRNVLSCPELYELPRLTRIVTAPVFSLSGDLQLNPGYDSGTKTFYCPSPGLIIPQISETPNEGEVEAARQLIWDTWLGDFTFTSISEHANALALVITPFVREMIRGATPLHLIEKNKPGTGATLLADISTILMLGEIASSGAAPESDAEWRKRISTKLLHSDPFFYIDNVAPGSLDYASVKQVLTVGTFEDRRLGTNDLIEEDVRCIWIATANNLALPLELLRRVVRIRLHALTDKPELRKSVEQGGDIRNPLLRIWTEENRSTLLWAIYTLVRNWVARGKPSPTVAPILGSFEHYCFTLGGILECAGVGGFLCNREDSYEMADPAEMAFQNFLMNLHNQFGDTPITIASMMAFSSELDLGGGSDHGRRIKLGRMLHEKRATPHSGYAISEPIYRDGYATYRIILSRQHQEQQKPIE